MSKIHYSSDPFETLEQRKERGVCFDPEYPEKKVNEPSEYEIYLNVNGEEPDYERECFFVSMKTDEFYRELNEIFDIYLP